MKPTVSRPCPARSKCRRRWSRHRPTPRTHGPMRRSAASTGGKRGPDAMVCLIVRYGDIEVNAVALRTRHVHLLKPDRRALSERVHERAVRTRGAYLVLVTHHRLPERTDRRFFAGRRTRPPIYRVRNALSCREAGGHAGQAAPACRLPSWIHAVGSRGVAGRARKSWSRSMRGSSVSRGRRLRQSRPR